MNAHDPLDIQAYRDGELPPDRARQLEATFDATMKARLAAEDRLEQRIVSRIKAESSPCPDSLWRDIGLRIEGRRARRFSRRFVSYMPIAAGILIACGLFLWQFYPGQARAVEIPVDFTQDISQFRQSVSFAGDLPAIQQRLRQEGYDVRIGDIAVCNQKHAHYVELIGADPVEIDGKTYPCIRLSFTCCGAPVVTYVIKGAEARASMRFSPTPADVNRVVQDRDGYRIVILSPHPLEAVESLFTAE